MRHWPIWRLPAPARRFVLVVDGMAAGCLGVLGLATSWRVGDVVTAVVLAACGALSIEVFRRMGALPRRSDRPHHNLLGAFLVPAALLLPPVYVGLMALPLHAVLQTRMTRLPVVKRVFNAAATVVYCVAAAFIYSHLAHPLDHRDLLRADAPTSVAVLLLAVVVYIGLNKLLMMEIIRRVAPPTPWRVLLGDGESWALAVGDVCAGVVLAMAWAVSPPFIVFVLVPVLLLQRAVVHTHLVAATRHDAKTGLANPAWWRHEAGRALTRAQHGGTSVSVLVVDVDHFKTVNDSYGHLFGDSVLAAVADTLRVVVRPGDLVGRFGGDEFTVLLTGADVTQAALTAERLRSRLAALNHSLPTGGHSIQVTASFGVAGFGPDGAALDELLAAADGAMYQAKSMGRNRVCLAARAPLPTPLSAR